MRINLRYFLLGLAATVPMLVFFRVGSFLSATAGSPQLADAIVILGGGGEARSLRGLELYQGKYAPVVLVTVFDKEILPFPNYYYDLRVRILLGAAVKREAIEFVGASRNSWQEAENTVKVAKARGWRRIIVVSDPPHMRRLRWTWRKVLKGSDIEFFLVSGSPSWWHAKKWWVDKQSREYVVNEYAKLLYYFFRY